MESMLLCLKYEIVLFTWSKRYFLFKVIHTWLKVCFYLCIDIRMDILYYIIFRLYQEIGFRYAFIAFWIVWRVNIQKFSNIRDWANIPNFMPMSFAIIESTLIFIHPYIEYLCVCFQASWRWWNSIMQM